MERLISIEDAIGILNQAINADPEAMNKLVGMRVSCNTTMAYHPTIQVRDQNGKYSLGVVGILNGIFGVENQNNFIAAEFDEEGRLSKFRRMD